MERNVKGMPETMPEVMPKGMPDTDNGCRESDEATLFDKPIGYAYVPIQRWRMLYTPEVGMTRGTLFEELDKPMEVYGNE